MLVLHKAEGKFLVPAKRGSCGAKQQSFSDQFSAGPTVKLTLSQKGAKGRNRKPQGLSLIEIQQGYSEGQDWFLYPNLSLFPRS